MKFETYETSSAQKRIYLIHQLHSNSIMYNMSFAKIIEGNLVCERLENALEKLLQRHEALRTAFTMKEGKILQKVYDTFPFKLKYLESSRTGIDKIIQNFIQPIDVHEIPLWRTGLVKIENKRQLLLFDIHHIIADGISINIIFEELISYYCGKVLPPLEYQYVDFTLWQNDLFKEAEMKKQEAYWLGQFSGDIPILNMPIDYPRLSEMAFYGESFEFKIEIELTRKLNKLARDQDATLYMVLLAAYNILLSRYTGQEDIVVGTPIAGRSHPELEKIVGMFVNTLANRNKPTSGKTVNDFLNEVTENSFLAFENQDYPFEMLVERLNPKRESNLNPLFNAMFALQNFSQRIHKHDYQTGEDKEHVIFFPYPMKTKVVRFDLTLFAYERKGRIRFKFDYRSSLFRKETIKQLAKHFCIILRVVSETVNVKIGEIQMLSREEIEYFLYALNDTDSEYPEEKLIHELFAEQAARTPDHIAVNSAGQGSRMQHATFVTYKRLNEKSGQLTQILRRKGLKEDSIVGIMVERSIEMIIGIMSILKLGSAYLPIDPDLPRERKYYILADSSANLLITSGNLPLEKEITTVDVVNISLDACSGDYLHLSSSCPTATSLAYAMYTSGTTGVPKGVLIEHRSVVNLVFGLKKKIYRYEHSINVALVAPYLFDASVKQIFAALLLGHTLSLVPKKTALEGETLIDYYKDMNIRVSDGTPAHLNILLNVEEKLRDDFPLDQFLIGGEELEADICKQFIAAVNKENFKIVNVYGPTECCDVSTLYIVDSDRYHVKQRHCIPIGNPLANMKVFVLGYNQVLQPIGVAGELCIGGAGVARGYLNSPDLSREKFVTDSFGQGGTLYRTGDLVRWLPDGNIEFLGRIDEQVKIRGMRIELGEIVNRLKRHRYIKDAVVTARYDENHSKYLCAYIVCGDTFPGLLDSTELMRYLSQTLPNYMIPTFFVNLERIPLTPSGKIDKYLLPKPEVKPGESCIAPRDRVEEELTELWADVLGLEKNLIGIDDDFFYLGGHSLKAINLAVKIHKAFDIRVPLDKIFKNPNIRILAECIKEMEKEKFCPLKPVEEKEYYDLSSAQKRLFILNEIGNVMTTYNLAEMMRVEGNLDRKHVERVCKRMIRRHESLRTSFDLIENKPVQIIHKEVDFKIEYFTVSIVISMNQIKEESLVKDFIRPFDLKKSPLIRIRLIKLAKEEHIFMLDMHHIISDGVSQGILMKEFVELYEENDLPSIRIQYKDFSEWQNSLFAAGRLEELENYWLDRFKGDIPVLNIPKDYPRPSIQNFEGEMILFKIDKDLTKEIKKLVADNKTTLYIGLLAVYNILLSKYSGQEDIIVGTPITGRNHADIQNVIGLFVNTLAIRTQPKGDKSFLDFLHEVETNAIKAYENQDYPFEELVNKLDISRDFSRNPLFDVLFVSENVDIANLSIKDLKFSPFESKNKTSHLDLVLYTTEIRDGIRMVLEYSTAILKRSTVEKMTKRYIDILRQVVERKEMLLKEIEVSVDLLDAKSKKSYEEYVGFGF